MRATREVALTLTLLPGTQNMAWLPCPLSGKITTIVRSWRDGCNQLVDMAVGRGDNDVWILPALTDTYVALNNAVPVIQTDEPVKEGEKLWLRGRNGDGGFPHTLNCTFVVEGDLP